MSEPIECASAAALKAGFIKAAAFGQLMLLNSAIQSVADRVSLNLHLPSRQAKDMGRAAQFMGLVLISVCWAVILI